MRSTRAIFWKTQKSEFETDASRDWHSPNEGIYDCGEFIQASGFSRNNMNRAMATVLAVTLLTSFDGLASTSLGSQLGESPRFSEFSVPAAEQFKGKPATPKLATREARKYRTMIREGAREGPNFASHYTIVQWGCGSGCVQFAVVDAKTGAVYVPPFYVGPRARIEAETEPDEPLQFRIDSKLLIVSGAPNEKNEGLYYYKWDKGRFVLLARTSFKKH